MANKINLEAIATELLFMQTHRDEVKEGNLPNDWTKEEWARYRHLKAVYRHHYQMFRQTGKRISYANIRQYNDEGVF
jgi:hypothetical protein